MTLNAGINNKYLIWLRNKLRHLPQSCHRPVFNSYARVCPLITNEADCVIDCENEIVWICSFHNKEYYKYTWKQMVNKK